MTRPARFFHLGPPSAPVIAGAYSVTAGFDQPAHESCPVPPSPSPSPSLLSLRTHGSTSPEQQFSQCPAFSNCLFPGGCSRASGMALSSSFIVTRPSWTSSKCRDMGLGSVYPGLAPQLSHDDSPGARAVALFGSFPAMRRMAINQMQGYPNGNSRIRLSWGQSQNNTGVGTPPPSYPLRDPKVVLVATALLILGATLSKV